MASYSLKILVDIEAQDDIDARRKAASAVAAMALHNASGVRDIVLHAQHDNKSIRMLPDGSFPGQWNKGGPGRG